MLRARHRSIARALTFAFLMVAGCAALPNVASAQAPAKIKVVASFSILADLVGQVGGDRVEVAALVGPNSDMHVFEPTPQHAKTVHDAQLFVINGLGLEGWADRLVKSPSFKGRGLVASKGIKALPGDAQGHGRYDPHAWQEVANVKTYVANIREALIALDPAGRPQYQTRAAAYLQQLDALETEIRSAFAPIPKAQRKVITSHEAFTYFGDAYEVVFLAPAGVGGSSQPSAKRVAELIRQIKRERVKAVFIENISNPRLVERISQEAGVTLGGTLYSDALSPPGGPAPTYLEMMRHNTRLIAEAIK